MKKSYILLFLFLMMPFMVHAEELKGNTTGGILRLRQQPSTTAEFAHAANGSIVWLDGAVTIYDSNVDSIDPANDGCTSKKWMKIKGADTEDGKLYEGYGCSDFIIITTNEYAGSTTDNAVIEDTVIKYGSLRNDYVYVSDSSASNRRSGKTSERVSILAEVDDKNTSGCGKLYKILYNNLVSYACKSSFINIVNAEVIDASKISYNYDEEIAKFPESYQTILRQLHAIHPNWRFYAINTGLDFNHTVNVEKNSSLIQMSGTQAKESFYDTTEAVNYDWKTNTYKPHEGSSWVTPSKEAVAYYVDPRTYLTTDPEYEKAIFVFEDGRAYTYQKSESADMMMQYANQYSSAPLTFEALGKTYTYADTFKQAAQFSKVSPLTLIARVRVETLFRSSSVSGTFEFFYDGANRSGYYNYYNIGAYGSAPITNGLIYAYNAGWNNRYKALIEGSTFLATKYIYTGQESQYFQKLNVNPNSLFNAYDHQYQSNIEAPLTESNFVYWGYKDTGNIDQPIVFHIPVYDNMPAAPTRPHDGNPNNWLTSIKVDNTEVTNSTNGFDGNVYYSYDNNWDNKDDAVYKNNVIRLTVPYEKESVNIDAIRAVNTSTVTGAGKQTLKVGENTLTIKVTAQNGTYKQYRLIITRQESDKVAPAIDEVMGKLSVKYNTDYISGLTIGTTHKTLVDAIKKIDSRVEVTIKKNINNKNESFATGDEITIKSGDDTKTFKYIVYGDLNGDGVIDLSDLVHVRNIILETSNLTSANKLAGDINKDNKVDLSDLVYVRNDILGTPINQG